ncbi:FHA domain-containing protein [Aerolutibacter daejeonensis]|uniref:FHA domain-containing protein n=1 Tax=Aerolutibacter daejeonensis TaxID=346181 RepID=UPI00068E2342|nr:FHA domain-containing protein [Lysobacter daejeonensis]
MPVRLIVYPPDTAALTRWVDEGARLRIGRGADCDLVLAHPSVSRAHAELVEGGGHWRLNDLGSKNGTFIDGIATLGQMLPHTAWLRLGDVHCEFEVFDDAQARSLRERQQERRALSMAATRRIAARHDADSLLDDVLRGVVELAGCSRGFMLLANANDFAVCASLLLDPAAMDPAVFHGSVGAVQRALESGQPVVVNHVDREPWLARRRSVAGSGLQSLVCLPLLDHGRTVGAIYADRREAGEPITDFDLELLGAFAESATLWLLARRAMQSLDSAPRWGTVVHRDSAEAAP